MENYAGFLEYADHHTGRVIDALEELGVLDDTLVYYIIGDNGASAEGTLNGTFNAMFVVNGGDDIETAEFMREQLDKFGGPESYPHYAVGWAHAMCTPYQWTKQVASHWGGTRNGTIVRWPTGSRARARSATSSHHVIDVAPTVLEAAGAARADSGPRRHPAAARGRRAWLYASTTRDAAERHETQYFEMFCNRGIYHKGWSAVTKHRTPWKLGPRPAA